MSTISVDYDVLNQRGSPAWFTDTFANIPTAGYVGRMFISKDTFAFYRDTGTGWDLIGGPGIGTLTGSGVVGQVSFFNGTQVLAGNNNLFWDNTNSRLGINTTTPGQPLDIHSTGNTLVQLNNTTTANSNISFQNQNVAKWRVGNVYNAGANSFNIENAGLLTNALTISSTTNNITLTGALSVPTLSVTNVSTLDGNILLKKAGIGVTSPTYVSQFAESSGVGIGYSDGTGGANFTFPTASISTYTFPASTGTIALTSNLSSYLPLAGGTLTGNLTINPTNTGVVGLDVASNTTRFRSDNTEGFKRQLEITMGSGTLVQLVAKGYLANYGTDMAFYTATTGGTNASPGIYITGTNNRVGIKTGTPAYDLDVTGNGRFNIDGLSSVFGTSTTTQDNYVSFVGQSSNFDMGVRSTANGNVFGIAESGVAYRFVIAKTTGFVGIGTSTPTRQLFVNSTAFFDNNGDGSTTSPSIAIGSTSVGLSYLSGGNLAFLTGALERMRISAAGNVGIGDSVTTNYKLIISSIDTGSSNFGIGVFNSGGDTLIRVRNDGAFFTGNAAVSPINNTTASLANANIGAVGDLRVSTASSQRFKNNIQDWNENGLETILAMKPKTFYYNADYYNYPNVKMLGLIAEEVAEICPYLAEYENEDRTGQVENVRYSNIVVPLIKAIQELNEKLVRNNIN